MLFPIWPPVAILALLMMLLIMVILIYGDRICARVKTHTERIAVRARPSLEPMMRMGSGSERQQRSYSPPRQHQHQQQHFEYEEEHQQRYMQQQPQPPQQYEAPMMELQKPTTYGREIEV